jgi:hypothetical protein
VAGRIAPSRMLSYRIVPGGGLEIASLLEPEGDAPVTVRLLLSSAAGGWTETYVSDVAGVELRLARPAPDVRRNVQSEWIRLDGETVIRNEVTP